MFTMRLGWPRAPGWRRLPVSHTGAAWDWLTEEGLLGRGRGDHTPQSAWGQSRCSPISQRLVVAPLPSQKVWRIRYSHPAAGPAL